MPEILNTGNPDEPDGFEQTMMWLAFKNDKPPDESILGENEEEKEEKWKKDWLDRMERRELVYPAQFLLGYTDNFQGCRFRYSCIYSGCAILHPTLLLDILRADPLLPGNGESGTSHRYSRLRISSSL